MAESVVRPRARWLRVVVVVLAVFCMAEVTVRARADTLIEPQLWPSPEQTYKSQQIGALAANGGASLIAIGSSTVDAAFDADLLTPVADARPAYNAATGGASLVISAGWSEFEAVPRLKPDTVVVGITSREMNPNDPQQDAFTHDFLSSRAFRYATGTENTMEVIERRVEDASALFRYRTILRQPQYMKNLLGIGNAPRDGSRASNDNGQRTMYLPRVLDKVTPDMKRHYTTTGLYKWELGRDEVGTLSRLLAFLDANVTNVLLVSMPITRYYVSWSPNGQADIDSFNAEMRGLADANGAKFLDAGVWPTELFADIGHLNRAGSARFMETINTELRSLGWR